MMDPRSRAAELFREAYEAQMRGDLQDAVRLLWAVRPSLPGHHEIPKAE